MNTSGEAAEQVFRMTLEGTEFAVKIAGSGAKNIAVLLYTILSQQKKSKGRARVASMLKSGKELDIFSIKESDLKEFSEQTKRYGILYAAVRDPKGSPDGLVDLMVKKEDAPKINRIAERFKFSAVEAATVKADIEKSKATKTPNIPEKTTPDKSGEDKLLDDLFAKPLQKEAAQQENPQAARMEKSPPSEPSLTKPSKSAEGTSKPPEKSGRSSVRQELHEINAAREKQVDIPKQESQRKNPSKSFRGVQHKQPQNIRKKTKKSKAR